MKHNLDLRKATQTKEFKDFWANKERSNWRKKATKTSIAYLYDEGDVFVKFETETYMLDDDLHIIVKANGTNITSDLEISGKPEDLSLKLAKAIAYYFYTRY